MPDPSTTLIVVGALSASVPAVMGFLLNRSIKAVDYTLARLGEKIDALNAQDTKILIELENLRTRVIALEFTVNGAKK